MRAGVRGLRGARLRDGYGIRLCRVLPAQRRLELRRSRDQLLRLPSRQAEDVRVRQGRDLRWLCRPVRERDLAPVRDRDFGQVRDRYFAYSTARVSRMTVTLICPG